MDDGHPGLHRRVRQVREEPCQLHGGQHSLVGDGPGGKGGKIDADFMLGPFADPVGKPVQIDATPPGLVGILQDQGPEEGHGGKGLKTQTIRICGNHPPGQDLQPLFGGNGGNGLLFLGGLDRIPVQEGKARHVVTRLRQVDIQAVPHEQVGHGNHDSRPIARVGLGTHGTSMVQVHQNLDGLIDDSPLILLVEGGHHADTAGIMLRCGVVETPGLMDAQIERSLEGHRNHPILGPVARGERFGCPIRRQSISDFIE